ncbi:hypothetical protein GCM10009527_096690 [Actinomadura nitritigenes]|uniref:Uncharacterized protein n=1 Tax=Actinomadura nitritigenes TaxID=134602 RepID=A0ABS3RFJ8_9ACTN|nr:hypothetical protein [Actinomadura nitritigenes]MBO2444988.1 hypothetical protein [Actinomadura nitritigenes]
MGIFFLGAAVDVTANDEPVDRGSGARRDVGAGRGQAFAPGRDGWHVGRVGDAVPGASFQPATGRAAAAFQVATAASPPQQGATEQPF